MQKFYFSRVFNFAIFEFRKFSGDSLRVFFFQAEDGIRDAQESRGLGDVYKRQVEGVWSKIAKSLQF